MIVEQLYPALRRFAALVAPTAVEPDDLVQEALYRTIRRAPLDEYEDPAIYLRRVIVNLAANERRSLGRRRRAVARLQAGDGSSGGSSPGRPGRSGRSAGTGEAGVAARYPSDVADLLRLPVEARAVLWMVEIEGATYAEAAAALGCTEEAARTRATRARRKLRAEIAEDLR
jgi:RNA polymerase sigma-70 factor (ECF subfamily)